VAVLIVMLVSCRSSGLGDCKVCKTVTSEYLPPGRACMGALCPAGKLVCVACRCVRQPDTVRKALS
jgi:hypothetical protein